MSREALDRLTTMKALIQAEERPEVSNNFFDTSGGNTITMSQRGFFDHDRNMVYVNDMVWDNGCNDTVSTGPGDDWMIAGAGADRYDGGDHFDIVAYVRANTAVKADLDDANGNSPFRETNGASFAFGDRFVNVEGLVGSRFGDTLRAHFSEASYLNGFDGNDILTGGRGPDVIKGGKGNDTIDGIMGFRNELFGGVGNDTITVGRESTASGGANSDTFVFDISLYMRPESAGPNGIIGTPAPMGEIVISDWNVGGAQDRISLLGLDDEFGMHIVQDGADRVITFDGVVGEIRLLDTTALEMLRSISID